MQNPGFGNSKEDITILLILFDLEFLLILG